MSAVNHQFRLAARPVGLPKRGDWTLTEEPAPAPGAEEFLVKILYISLDPAMRGWMNEGRSYVAPVGIGEVMRAAAVGKVIGSKHPGFAVGDHVYGRFGVQEYAVSKGDGVTKVDPSQAPLPVFLGTLGLPGMTAYFGLLDIGKPQAGQTVVVSGAAGAVGMVAGQKPGSMAAASLASPAAPRSAAISSPRSASMRRLTTRPKMCARRCASDVPKESTFILTTSAGTFSMRRWPTWGAMPVS